MSHGHPSGSGLAGNSRALDVGGQDRRGHLCAGASVPSGPLSLADALIRQRGSMLSTARRDEITQT